MAEQRRSLRGRLLALLLGATGAIWLAVAAATFADARTQAERLFDAQLAEYSEVLAAIAGHEVFEVSGETTHLENLYSTALSYQVWSVAGELLLKSHAAPDAPLAMRDGYSDAKAAGKRWRVFRRTDADRGLVIVAAQDAEIREDLRERIAMHVAVPALLGLPLIGLAIWLAVARSVAPLGRLAGELRRRAPDHLEPVEARAAPAEVAPLVEALNQLFARLAISFENERRFTGDAAHELRTPLAALRTQAEVALTTASDERRRHALQQVIAGVERATRLVEQLLALARLDAAAPRALERVDLAEVAREAVELLESLAAARGIRLEWRPPEGASAVVAGDAPMLHALVRNLADNAIRYTPSGGTARVALARHGDRVALAVEDSGPGVEPALRERIFDRFFRAGGEGGSGLGLSIARRIVELHGGSIGADASPDLGGLRIAVSIPAAA